VLKGSALCFKNCSPVDLLRMFLLLAFEAVAFGDAKHAVPGRLNSQQGLHSSLFRGKACGSYGFYSGAIVADSVVAEMYFFFGACVCGKRSA